MCASKYFSRPGRCKSYIHPSGCNVHHVLPNFTRLVSSILIKMTRARPLLSFWRSTFRCQHAEDPLIRRCITLRQHMDEIFCGTSWRTRGTFIKQQILYIGYRWLVFASNHSRTIYPPQRECRNPKYRIGDAATNKISLSALTCYPVNPQLSVFSALKEKSVTRHDPVGYLLCPPLHLMDAVWHNVFQEKVKCIESPNRARNDGLILSMSGWRQRLWSRWRKANIVFHNPMKWLKTALKIWYFLLDPNFVGRQMKWPWVSRSCENTVIGALPRTGITPRAFQNWHKCIRCNTHDEKPSSDCMCAHSELINFKKTAPRHRCQLFVNCAHLMQLVILVRSKL